MMLKDGNNVDKSEDDKTQIYRLLAQGTVESARMVS